MAHVTFFLLYVLVSCCRIFIRTSGMPFLRGSCSNSFPAWLRCTFCDSDHSYFLGAESGCDKAASSANDWLNFCATGYFISDDRAVHCAAFRVFGNTSSLDSWTLPHIFHFCQKAYCQTCLTCCNHRVNCCYLIQERIKALPGCDWL